MAPIIAGDNWLEILQFLTEKRKSGMLVFPYQADLELWNRQKGNFLLDNGCFYIPQMQTWRYEATTLRLYAITEIEDVQKVRGLHVDKIWYMGNIRSDLARLVEAHCNRLPATTTQQ